MSHHVDHLPGTFFGPANLVELLQHRARCQAEDTAFTYLIDGEHEQVQLTYHELDRQARAIGAWLGSLGLAGERALLLYPAGLEFITAFFGCLYAGVAAVPVYPPRRNRSLARIQSVADDADAKVALTTDSVLSRVEPLIDETPHLKQLTWLATSNVPQSMEEQWRMPDVHGETLAFLQYTSGSTGTPKGVVLNHANLVHNSALIAHAFEHTRSSIGVFWLPSYHDMGLIGGILQPLYVGRPNVLMSPMSFLQKPFRWLDAISRFRGTTCGGPNFAYDLCVRKVTREQRKRLDLSSWKVAFNGAEPVREETLERFVESFTPCGFRREAFYPCYGLAEATLLVSGGRTSDPPVIRTFEAGSLAAGRVVDAEPDNDGVRSLVGCGKSLPDQTIAIADPETMTRVPDGRIGEIWVCGPSVAQGYWREAESTETTFRACLKDTGEGPFLRTGDLGFIEDGELFVTGRLKDLMIVRGMNVYPQDVEQTVQAAHPRLRIDCGAAFTAEVDGRQRFVVVQEVERRNQGNFDAVFDTIVRAVAAEHELALDAVVLVKAGSIPKTSSGKIQRHACLAGYLDRSLDVVAQWQASDLPKASATARPAGADSLAAADSSGNGQVTAARKKVTEVVLEEIRRVGKQRVEGLTLDSEIVETGLDSLERMEILASIEERFGGRFPEDVLPELGSVRLLVDAVIQYLGSEPRTRKRRTQAAPPETYEFARFPEIVRMRQSLDLLDASGVANPFFVPHEGVANDRTIINGRELINFGNFNYQNMSGHPVVAEAAKAAVERYGTSAAASRLVSGETDLHRELERELADFLGVEDAIAMVSGHGTNESVIGHLLGPGDLALHDALAHNSITQGCILSGARRRPFAHNDFEAADRLLSDIRGDYRRVLIAIEGVYSMDGDIPDLPKFIELKKRHQALLMVDEAHSLGVLGDRGRGVGEHFGIDPTDVDIWMGSAGKALGSCGGYIAGCQHLIEYLKYTAPGFVFAVGMAPPAAAASLASLRIWRQEPERFPRIRQNSQLLLSLVRQLGLNTGPASGTAVVPVILGNSFHCLRLSNAMLDRGVNVMPILHPAVEESAARMRFFVTVAHSEEQIRYTVDVLAEELEKIDPKYVSRMPHSEATTG